MPGRPLSPDRPSALLLVCATALELREALRPLPGGPALDLSFWEQGADLGGSLSASSGAGLARLPLPGCDVYALVCGVGPVAAGITLGAALARLRAQEQAGPAPRPLGVLNLGIAGTYDPVAAPVGSLVLATEEIYPEFGLWPGEGERAVSAAGVSAPGEPLPMTFPQGLLPTGPVRRRLALAPDEALGIMGLNCHSASARGASVTLAGASATPGRAGRVAALSLGLMENMEGFALALVAAAASLPFVEMRAISNQAGHRPPRTWNMTAACSALARAAQDLFAPYL